MKVGSGKGRGISLGLINTAVSVPVSILTFLGGIPQPVRQTISYKVIISALLIFACMYVISSWRSELRKGKPGWRFIKYGFVGLAFLCLALSAWFPIESNKEKKDHTTNVLNEINENSVTIQDSGNSSTKNHIINGNNNVVGVNGDVTNIYNQRPARIVEKRDINKILAEVPSRLDRLRISYSSNDDESSVFAAKIFDALMRLGYTNLSKSQISNAGNVYTKDRFVITRDKFPTPVVNLIVNPQIQD